MVIKISAHHWLRLAILRNALCIVTSIILINLDFHIISSTPTKITLGSLVIMEFIELKI